MIILIIIKFNKENNNKLHINNKIKNSYKITFQMKMKKIHLVMRKNK